MAQDKARLFAMLGSHSSWSDPPDPERAALADLAAEGLVEVTWRRAFRCTEAETTDPEDTVLWTSCDAWVLVPDDAIIADDGSTARAVHGEARCTWCGEAHRFGAAPRLLVDHASVTLRKDGIKDWMASRLWTIDPDLQPLRWGMGWRAWLSGDEVSVVWVEESQGARTLSAAFAAGQPTVYVTTGAWFGGENGPRPPGAVVLSLADWLDVGEAALLEAATKAAELSTLMSPLRMGPAPSHGRPPRPRRPTSDARWTDVTMWLVDGDTVRIERPEHKPRSWTAAELGLVHARARDRRHTKGWKLLVALCEGHGTCDWRSSDNRSYAAFKVQVSGLAKQLRSVLGIDAAPFHPTSPAGGLRAIFRAGPMPEAEVYVGEDRWGA